MMRFFGNLPAYTVVMEACSGAHVEMGDGKKYKCRRDFAASIGLVPRHYPAAELICWESANAGTIPETAIVQYARVYKQRLDYQHGALAEWVRSLFSRRNSNVVACALTNKLARIAWAITARHTKFEIGLDAMAF